MRIKTGFYGASFSDGIHLCYVFKRRGQTFAHFPESTIPVLKRPQSTEAYVLEANLFPADDSYVRKELHKAISMVEFIYESRGRFDERHVQARRSR